MTKAKKRLKSPKLETSPWVISVQPHSCCGNSVSRWEIRPFAMLSVLGPSLVVKISVGYMRFCQPRYIHWVGIYTIMFRSAGIELQSIIVHASKNAKTACHYSWDNQCVLLCEAVFRHCIPKLDYLPSSQDRQIPDWTPQITLTKIQWFRENFQVVGLDGEISI